MEALDIFLKAAFIDNMVLAYFLGMCSYLAVSKSVKTAFGLGIAVVFVLAMTAPINWLITNFLLKEGMLIEGVGFEFLGLILYISVIAALVQFLEMFIEKVSPSLYNALGIFLPLITVNCAILGATLFIVAREYKLGEATAFGIGSGFGFFLAIVALAAIREKLRTAQVPPALQGVGIAFIITGLMGIAFMSLLGLKPSTYFG
jgi:Na+-transporting NADH:ubiquinone oxidoreductase subunit E